MLLKILLTFYIWGVLIFLLMGLSLDLAGALRLNFLS